MHKFTIILFRKRKNEGFDQTAQMKYFFIKFQDSSLVYNS